MSLSQFRYFFLFFKNGAMLMGFANFAPHKEKSYYIVEFGDWSNINSSKK